MRRKDRQIAGIEDIESIIAKSDVCRIALADNNIPYMVVMNFGYTGGEIKYLYFHCANEGRKLEMIRKNNLVCFEMDTDHQIYSGSKGCDWGMKYSSVVGYGNITVMTQKEDKEKGLDCIMKHYGGDRKYSYDDKIVEETTILKLEITRMTGKRK